MAPQKVLTSQKVTNTTTNVVTGVVTRRGLANRQQNIINNAQSTKQQTIFIKDTRNKRKAETSPAKEKILKRSALGNITNAIGKTIGAQIQDASKKVTKKITTNATVKTVTQQPTSTLKSIANNKVVQPQTDDLAKPKQASRVKTQLKKDDEDKKEISNKTVNNLRRSVDLEKSDESSLYVSALESLPEESNRRLSRSQKQLPVAVDTYKSAETTSEEKLDKFQIVLDDDEQKIKPTINRNPAPERTLPKGIEWDFDVENWNDPYQISTYAMDIFDYLKDRERHFLINDYMEKQVCLSRWMRSLLIDWMVAVQESFELNHETLYLAVKLVDSYLCKVIIGKESLQLLGAASLFIASKFDERIPPLIDDFLYICDGAYTHRELTRMEINVLKVVNFDLGIPISYRFLRRYARCAKVTMPTLTLARYILEYSLLDYATVSLSDSKLAAAALFLALQMKDLGGWTETLEYYTGYKLADFSNIVYVLNEGLHRKPKDALSTVRNKYSHKIFFEVAKVPLKEKLDI